LTARHLLTLFDSVYLAALSVWIGGAVFLIFALRPVLFRTLDVERAFMLIRAVYPRYYAGGAISGAVALAAFVAGPLCYHEYRGAAVGVQALAIIVVILLLLYGANSLSPQICAAGLERASSPKLAQLHRRAAALDLVVLLLGLSLLVVHAARPVPKTSGIIELTGAERARYDAALNRVIEDVEAKYGFRPPRPKGSAESAAPGPSIDAETVRELESFYAKKRLRDQARAGKVPSTDAPK
jgi:hypothetical protein